MPSDALTLLKRDHREVKKLFRAFRKQEGNRKQLAENIIGELTVHTYLENQVIYPAVRKMIPDLDDDILESYEEHHVVDLLAMEILELNGDDERFEAKMTVLMEAVEHHVEEEEEEWFPVVRENLSRADLRELGEKMEELRPTAPRRPDKAPAKASAGKGRGKR
jgi:hemerythrin superfamily protein